MSKLGVSKIYPLRSLSEQISLSEAVTQRLREAINSCALLLGTHLVERDIAEQLGISRVPVRKAIQQLVDEGLVIKKHRRGAYVQPYSAREVAEVYSLRVQLEFLVVENAIANWTPGVATRMREIVDAMDTAGKANDMQRLCELDNQYHEVLWRLADHNLLLEVVTDLRTRIDRFLNEATKSLSGEAVARHVERHYKLIDLLQDGDVEVAKAEIREHILIAKERINRFYHHLSEAHS